MNKVIENAEDLYKTRNQIINVLEGKQATDEQSKKVNLNDLLYAGLEKLTQIKNEYNSG